METGLSDDKFFCGHKSDVSKETFSAQQWLCTTYLGRRKIQPPFIVEINPRLDIIVDEMSRNILVLKALIAIIFCLIGLQYLSLMQVCTHHIVLFILKVQLFRKTRPIKEIIMTFDLSYR